MRVAIVGGGIGGLTAAIALLRTGIEVSVFEQTPELSEVGAGIQLGPNAVRLLRRLDLGRPLREVAICPDAAWKMHRWKDGRVLFLQPLGEDNSPFGAPCYALHRADLLDVLLQAVPEGVVHLGRRCVGMSQGGGGVEVTFDDGTKAYADLVVGADGIHSTVRDAIVTHEPARFSGLGAYRGLVAAERVPQAARREAVTYWLGPHRHLVHYPVSGGRLINFVAVVPASDWQDVIRPTPARVEDALAEFAGWDERARRVIGAAEEIRRWALYDLEPLARWIEYRITLLGDAAHPMLPFLAQGASQAIEDAVGLAGCLRGTNRETVELALRRYEAIRRPRAEKVQRLSRIRGQEFHLPDGEQQRRRDARLAEEDPSSANAWLYGHDVERELAEEWRTTEAGIRA